MIWFARMGGDEGEESRKLAEFVRQACKNHNKYSIESYRSVDCNRRTKTPISLLHSFWNEFFIQMEIHGARSRADGET